MGTPLSHEAPELLVSGLRITAREIHGGACARSAAGAAGSALGCLQHHSIVAIQMACFLEQAQLHPSRNIRIRTIEPFECLLFRFCTAALWVDLVGFGRGFAAGEKGLQCLSLGAPEWFTSNQGPFRSVYDLNQLFGSSFWTEVALGLGSG